MKMKREWAAVKPRRSEYEVLNLLAGTKVQILTQKALKGDLHASLLTYADVC
jgi:hypothetical protein